MTTATLNPEQINKLIEFVNEVFPDWQGFSDPRFEKAEVAYKQKAFQKAKTLLKESDLSDLIVQGNFDEFIDRLTKMGRSTNLLYQAVPMQGDLNVLFQENLDKPAFCRAFMDLIYGSASTPERLEKYSSFLKENRLPNRWTFPTYFLFACHPESEMFVKPTTTQWFVQFSGMVDPFPTSPSGEIYGQLLDLCKQLWDGLQKYQPHDFVDIQGFIWAASSASQKKNKLSKPFNKMFKDWQEAQWAFDLLQTAAEHLGIQKPDDILVSVTNPNGLEIRLTYGIWWVLGIKTKANTIRSILVTLYKDKIKLPWIYEGDFKTTVTEPPTTLYELSVKDFKENQEQIMEVFAETMQFVSERFGEWKANPHHQANIEKLLSAIINPDLRDETLTKGISVEKGVLLRLVGEDGASCHARPRHVSGNARTHGSQRRGGWCHGWHC